MHNAECIIVVSPAAMIFNKSRSDTFIMHYEFCIMHS